MTKSVLIIVGLGNPGVKYDKTRHNAGFMAIDYLAQHIGASTFHKNAKFAAEIAESSLNGQKVILAKPTTFMNRSGQTVQALCHFYKSDISSDVIIVHDDLDIQLEQWKDAHNRSAAGHNGIIDIIEKMGTKEFRRIRIGIENRTLEQRQHMSGANYVLGRFTDSELEKIYNSFTEFSQEIVKTKAN